MPAGYAAHGTLFQVSDMAATPVWTTVANVSDISGPEYTRDTIDVTSHSSTGGYKEYINGLKDGGNVTFDLLYIGDATQTTITDLYESGDVNDFRIKMPITDTGVDNQIDFSGIVTTVGAAFPLGDAIKRSVTIKVTGPATWSEAA